VSRALSRESAQSRECSVARALSRESAQSRERSVARALSRKRDGDVLNVRDLRQLLPEFLQLAPQAKSVRLAGLKDFASDQR
jgi:hypothetical protein